MADFEAIRKTVAEYLEGTGWKKIGEGVYERETKVGKNIARISRRGLVISIMNFITGEGNSTMYAYEDCVFIHDGIFIRTV